MALVNPNIAMSFRGVEMPQQNALADYAAIQQIQGGRQAQELNALKMQQAQKEINAQNVLAGAYAGATNPETGAIDYTKLRSALATGGGGAQILAVEKLRRESETAALTQQESAFKVQDAKNKFIAQAKRDTSQNPSDANITAYMEDLVANPLFSEAEKQQLKAGASRLLAMPLAERRAFMASQGASASELKPTVSVGPTGIVQTPAFGGSGNVVAGTGAAFQMTPGQIETNRIAKARLEFDKYKFNWEKANPGFELKEDENGDVYGINRNTLKVVPVNMGGGAPSAGAPSAGGAAQAPLVGATPTAAKQFRGKGQGMTEGERKASTLLQRLRFSEGQLTKALVDDPDAAKPGVFTSALNMLSTPLANTLTPEARQRVQSAQLDILDAALTLGTGAAYTKEQLEGYRSSYFPAIGDGPTQVKDKKARLQNVISAANIAAGKGAKLVPETSSGAGAGEWKVVK